MLRHRTTFGPASTIMSLGTECAGEQDKFWEFHDARIRNGSSNIPGQISLAGDLGLNVSQFTACMEEERYQTSLEEDRTAAQAYGVLGQPVFVISSGGEWERLVGWKSAEQLSAVIDEYLN